MKAIVVKKLNQELSDLKVTLDHPKPELAGDGSVRVGVKAAGCNFYDLLMIQGTYQIKQEPPFILGTEFSGVVLETQGVTPYKVGDRVFGCGLGAYADEIIVQHDMLLPLPANVSYADAAGIFITYPTALAGLKLRGNLKPGMTCLIHGASGGVGLAAVQIAKLLGAKVIATGSNDDKLKVTQKFGADHTINIKTHSKDWPNLVTKLTPSELGVDVVYDTVGLINLSMKCIKFSGTIIPVGFAGGKAESVAMNRVLLKNISISGLHWGAYSRFQPNEVGTIWQELIGWLVKGQLKSINYHKNFKLEETNMAISELKDRKTYGKVIIMVGDEKEVQAKQIEHSKL